MLKISKKGAVIALASALTGGAIVTVIAAPIAVNNVKKAHNETEDLNKKMKTLIDEKDNLSKQLDAKSKNIIDLEEVLKAKNIEIVTLNNRITELESNVNTDQKTIADLKSQITDLNSQITDLKSQITDLKSQITDLNNQIAGLQNQINDLQDQIANNIVTIFDKKVEELQKQLDQINWENTELKYSSISKIFKDSVNKLQTELPNNLTLTYSYVSSNITVANFSWNYTLLLTDELGHNLSELFNYSHSLQVLNDLNQSIENASNVDKSGWDLTSLGDWSTEIRKAKSAAKDLLSTKALEIATLRLDWHMAKLTAKNTTGEGDRLYPLLHTIAWATEALQENVNNTKNPLDDINLFTLMNKAIDVYHDSKATDNDINNANSALDSEIQTYVPLYPDLAN